MTELGELRRHFGEIAARGVDVVAVSVDPPEISERLRQKVGAPIRFLSDEQGVLMDALGVRDRDALPPELVNGGVGKDRASRDLYLATDFLLDEEGIVRWVYRPDTFRVRAPAQEMLRAIDALGPFKGRPASPRAAG